MAGAIIKAAAVALVASMASLAAVAGVGVELSGNALWLPILCPLLIAFPASAYNFWHRQKLQALHDELGKTHAALEEAHARLAERSRHDQMTGFLNRESFFAAVEDTRRRSDRGTFLLIDADHFKRINDAYGHLVGDDALLEIVEAIRQSVRAQDIIGRIGGDDFGALLPGTSAEEANATAERIRTAVEAVSFMPAQGKTMGLSVSIGAAVCWPEARMADLMLKADRQLQFAKRAGRNRIHLDTRRPMAA